MSGPGVLPFTVASDRVQYTDSHILADYEYSTTRVTRGDAGLRVTPVTHQYKFKTDRRVPKLGYDSVCNCCVHKT
jgi:myo-inositol-1-phosphate synthase